MPDLPNTNQILSLIGPAIFFLFGATFFAAWSIDRTRSHVLFFGIALFLYSLGMASQILHFPPDVGQNALVSAGLYVISSLVLMQGILGRMGRGYPIAVHVCVFGAILFGIYHYFYVDRDLSMRIYILNFGIGALFLITAVRAQKLRSGKLTDRILFWVFLLFAIQFFLRTLLTMGGDVFKTAGPVEIAAFGLSSFWIALQISLSIFGAALALTLLAGVASDAFDDLRRERDTDPLTRLLNRRAFDRRAAEMVPPEETEPVCAIVFDIDHFKAINDTFGHHVGDEVLRQIGHIVQDAAGENRLAGRIGGEEFAILLKGGSREGALELAERLRTTLEGEVFRSLAGWKVTASFGIAMRRPAESIASLFTRADVLLYRAKGEGRNRSHWDQTHGVVATAIGCAIPGERPADRRVDSKVISIRERRARP